MDDQLRDHLERKTEERSKRDGARGSGAEGSAASGLASRHSVANSYLRAVQCEPDVFTDRDAQLLLADSSNSAI